MKERSILVVDDQPEMRIALTEVLQQAGYQVETASNGKEGLDKFTKNFYPVVISDVKMPRLDGVGLLREIKKVSTSTKVILITAYGTIDNAVQAMKEGAFDYLLKPFPAEALESVISRAWAFSQSNCGREEGASNGGKGDKTIITANMQMIKLIQLAQNIACSKATVLIRGESGTGKELFAKLIHQSSSRKDKPFIAVNCAALPEGLLESELFGYEKGAFTGATTRKEGKFGLANEGTILLDEISEMPLSLQAKLLRVLQEQEVDRVGGRKPVSIDVRVIATANKDLRKMAREGQFREDLYHRLNVIPLIIPSLKERQEDIPLLADFFIKKYGSEIGYGKITMSEEALACLSKYSWPGNVRELENTMHRALLLASGEPIVPRHLGLEIEEKEKSDINETGEMFRVGMTVSEMEKQLICKTLQELKGNRTYAAKALGISIRTLRNKIHDYNIKDL